MAEDAHDDLKKTEDVLPNPEANPRNERMKEIADAEVKDGMVDVEDGDLDKTVEIPDENPEPAAAAPSKRKITVNGREQELTDEELVKLAEKSAGADEAFREAARLRKEAEELRKPTQKEADTTVDDDDRALARAIQMGSEEEAAAVIRKIKSRPSDTNADARMIDQRIEFRQSVEWFQKEYADIVADPNMLQLVLTEDEKLVAGGDKRTYRARYEQIGNSLRKWRDGLKPPSSVTDKIERKASLHVVPAASVRAAPPREENDGPSDRDFIAAEAKRRGQGYPH